MKQLNQRIPIKFLLSSKQIYIVLLVAILSGLTGYLIGVGTEKSKKSQLVPQSIPIPTILSPTPNTVAPTATLYPTPTLDPAMVNWQTYTDTKYGFSFKYPPHWSFVGISTQNNSQIYADN